MTFPMHRPKSDEYASFYAKYVSLVIEDDVVAAMKSQLDDAVSLLRGVSEDEAGMRHPPYTWTVREVLGHVTDAERIFGYRALRFGRGDATPLPGFDENEYARTAGYDGTALTDWLSEFEAVRLANICLFRNLPEQAWSRQGVASENPVSVHALAYIIVGHTRHHVNILRTRLGKT